MNIQTLINNANATGNQTQTVAAAAHFFGLNAQSLCCWCAEKVEGQAFRILNGGECSKCPEVGRDVLVIAQ